MEQREQEQSYLYKVKTALEKEIAALRKLLNEKEGFNVELSFKLLTAGIIASFSISLFSFTSILKSANPIQPAWT